jgi:tRNA A37 threonylcarbamoyladenosine dehydratase
MDEAFSRLELLVGHDGCDKLANASVFLCGVGGVGSWAAEALVRGGIGHLTIMDPDVVKPSNINRQLCALHSTIGRLKVEVVAERLNDISPSTEITALPHHLQPQECAELIENGNYNCVIDAIDERPPKISLIMACHAQGVPIISSVGAANKMNPSSVRIADISDTSGCCLARIIRKTLRKVGITTGVTVVFSPELPYSEIGEEAETEGEKRPLGSISYMPAIFGLNCAAAAISQILK